MSVPSTALGTAFQTSSQRSPISERFPPNYESLREDFNGSVAALSDADIQNMSAERARKFHDDAPMTAAQKAKVILDGVKAERWRILVGDDAHLLDKRVRENPENAYEPEFYKSFAEATGWRVGG